MSVGDVTSKERGTGARFNSGKPPLHFIPPMCFAYYCEHPDKQAWAWLQAGWEGRLKWIDVLGCMEREYSPDYMDEAARVFEFGAEKYAPFNWAKGMQWSIALDCAMRHLRRASSPIGEEMDPESGFSHLAHMFCNLIMLAYFEVHYKEGNDLPSWLSQT